MVPTRLTQRSGAERHDNGSKQSLVSLFLPWLGPTVASLIGEDAGTQNSKDSSQNEAEENDELIEM